MSTKTVMLQQHQKSVQENEKLIVIHPKEIPLKKGKNPPILHHQNPNTTTTERQHTVHPMDVMVMAMQMEMKILIYITKTTQIQIQILITMKMIIFHINHI